MMGILGFILLIIALAYLIYDDRKRFADLRKFKKLMRKARRETRKETWAKVRNSKITTDERKEKPQVCPEEGKKQLPDGSFTLEYHFRNRLKTNLDQVNAALAEYELRKLEVMQYSGYVEAETESDTAAGKQTVRYWYGVDDITLRCKLAKPGEGQKFRLSTMTAEKTVKDCALLWQENNPDRKLCYKIFREYEPVYALLLVHHWQKPGTEERPIVAHSQKIFERTIPKLPRHDKPAYDNSGLTWHQEGDVLYIEGQGVIAERAFEEDDTIRKVVIAPGCVGIGDCAFADCDFLEEVVLPEGLDWIGECAFYRCSCLEKITIPNTVEDIFDSAFDGCENLNPLKIPSSVANIRLSAFNHVPEIHYNGPDQSDDNWGAVCALRMEKDVLHIHCQGSLSSVPRLDAKEVVIHEGCTDIAEFAFRDWDNLDTVHTPVSLRHINQNAFSGCHDVTLNMRDTRPVWNSRDNVFPGVYRVLSSLARRIEGDTLYIGQDDEAAPYVLQMLDEGVYGMNWMEPDTWERHKGWPWGGRRIPKIRHAVIAPGCVEIGESVFCRHTALETVSIPMGVEKIGISAFMGCENLKSLEIPDSVTEIESGAFDGVPHIIYHGPARSDDNWGAKRRN